MRVRDIKESMKVRVKNNACALTTTASPCWNVGSDGLKELQGKIGTVLLVDTDKTIKVLIDGEHRDDWSWFDAVHLEAIADEISIDVIATEPEQPLTRKEELERSINEAIETEAKAIKVVAAARAELSLLNNIISCAAIRGGEAKDGVYSISNSKAKCVVLNKVALYIPSGAISNKYELLDDSWRSNTFTLTTLKLVIGFK